MLNELGKVPPQALDLEEIVLGSMMLERRCIEEVTNIINSEAFYKEAHQQIYDAIVELNRKGDPVDIVTVAEILRSNGTLQNIGGPVYITGLTNRIGSTANVIYHARIILQKFIQREIIRISSELSQDAYDDITDPLELVERLGKGYDSISMTAQSGAEMVHISQVINNVCTELMNRERFAKEGKVSGIPTPLKGLNKMLGGWMPSDLIIIAARPSMGKTAFMLQIAKSAAVAGYRVGIFSMEMSRVSLANRLVLAESGIDDDRFRSGYVDSADWEKFNTAQQVLDRLQIFIDDRPSLSMHEIKAKAVQMKRSGKCDIVLIDYLQLTSMKSENRQYNREQEVSESSRTAKAMAKTMNVPVILLSQLSREVEKRQDKTPILSDLRESGSIEQDADVVIFPHRPAYYDPDGPNEGIINLIVAKHRNGPIGVISACHNESMTRIFDKPMGENYTEPTNNPF